MRSAQSRDDTFEHNDTTHTHAHDNCMPCYMCVNTFRDAKTLPFFRIDFAVQARTQSRCVDNALSTEIECRCISRDATAPGVMDCCNARARQHVGFYCANRIVRATGGGPGRRYKYYNIALQHLAHRAHLDHESAIPFSRPRGCGCPRSSSEPFGSKTHRLMILFSPECHARVQERVCTTRMQLTNASCDTNKTEFPHAVTATCVGHMCGAELRDALHTHTPVLCMSSLVNPLVKVFNADKCVFPFFGW